MAPMCNGGRSIEFSEPRSGDSLPAPGFSKFPLLDRRGRRERLSLIASGGVVDKQPLTLLIYHPVCACKEGGHFLYGADTPPVQEGKFAGRHIFPGGWQTFAATMPY